MYLHTHNVTPYIIRELESAPFFWRGRFTKKKKRGGGVSEEIFAVTIRPKQKKKKTPLNPSLLSLDKTEKKKRESLRRGYNKPRGPSVLNVKGNKARKFFISFFFFF